MAQKVKAFFLLLLVSGLGSLVPGLSHARLNVSVTENPWIYQAIDKLVSFGLVDSALLSQKPISYSEVIRIKTQARENIKRMEGEEEEPRALMLIKQIEELLPQEAPKKKVNVHPLDKLRLEYLVLDSPERAVLQTNAGHQINALLNPLVRYRSGRPFVDGQNFQFEMEQTFELEPYFSISGEPQFFLLKQDKSEFDQMIWSFDHFYLRSEFKNIGLQFGRDQVVWGPTLKKGNVFSANARGLDMFKISNVHPFHLPWFFKYLGYVDATFIFAPLESSREFPHAYVTAFKLSFLPYRNFQFGFTAATMSGGKGSPSSSLGNRILDPFVGYLLNIAGGNSPIDVQASNRIGGFDFKWRIPPLRGSELYYEVTFEDVNVRYKYYLETFNRGGLYIPRLSKDGRHSLRLEYNFAGFLPYRHTQFISGWTHNRIIMGDELGPDAQAVHAEYTYSPTRFWESHAEVSLEFRDSDLYDIPPPPGPVRKISDGFKETRARFLPGLDWKATKTFVLGLNFGYEHVWRFNFVPGGNRNNFLGDIQLTWFPKS